jgi:biotin carboxylase
VGTDHRPTLAQFQPDRFLTLDLTRPEEAARRLKEFAASRDIGAVLAADDEGVVAAALAARELGLRHHPPEAVRACRDKHRMREALAAADIPSPAFARVPAGRNPQDAAGLVPFPCVLKPLSLSASRGVIRADTPLEFARAFARIGRIMASRGRTSSAQEADDAILVESFLPGDEYAVEGLVDGGDLRPLAVFEKPDALDGPFFEETIYLTPARLPPERQERLLACVRRMVDALGLTDGPIHAELRVNDSGVWPIEIAPRSIGGLCSRSLRFGEETPLEELILRQAFHLPLDGLERERAASGVMMIPIPRAGTLREVRGVDEARCVTGVEEVLITIPRGQEVAPPPEGSRYLGFLFARAAGPEAVESALRAAHALLDITIDPPPGRG